MQYICFLIFSFLYFFSNLHISFKIIWFFLSFVSIFVFDLCHSLSFANILFLFLVLPWLKFLGFVSFWVGRLCPNLGHKILSEFEFMSFIQNCFINFFSSSQRYANTICFFFTPICLFYIKFCSSQPSLAIATSFWTMSSRFIRAIFFSRFPFSCKWPSLFTEKISCLFSLSCLILLPVISSTKLSRWYDWQ